MLSLLPAPLPIVTILATLVVVPLFMFYPLYRAWSIWRAHRKEEQVPSVGSGLLLWVVALGSAVLTCRLMFWTPPLVTVPIVAGILACGVVGTATFLARWRRFTFRKAMVFSSVAGAMLFVWADLRFSMVVRDHDENLTEWTGPPPMFRRGHGPLTQDQFAGGTRLMKGVIYFGLFKWLEYKGGWEFSTEAGSAAGAAEWSRWPWLVTYPALRR